MPIFEYQCTQCDTRFERLVRGQETAECPQCGSRAADKLLSAPAAHVRSGSLPIASECRPSDAPPCGPGCCRLP
jgi:putative FmdB family regulatory protein